VTIQSAAVSVGTTATALNAAESAGSDRVSLVVYNNGASTIYVGGSDVTTSNGVPIAAGASLAVNELDVAERLYGIVASGTVEARVLRQGVG